jgi:hypothetical protein
MFHLSTSTKNKSLAFENTEWCRKVFYQPTAQPPLKSETVTSENRPNYNGFEDFSPNQTPT